jgi:hypothetical protein
MIMNFGKLLGAGKSFVNGGKAAAYREDKRVYLPKFVSPKNPFTSSTQTELPKPPPANSVTSVKKSKTPTWAKTRKIPAISAAPKPAGNWTGKLNPISMLLGSQSKTAGQGVTRPIQVELSLEKVKVVHNDLTDAEVEIVPVKSRPAREADTPVLRPAKQSWEVLGEQIFGVKTT